MSLFGSSPAVSVSLMEMSNREPGRVLQTDTLSSGMLRCVVSQNLTDVSEVFTASIIKVIYSSLWCLWCHHLDMYVCRH